MTKELTALALEKIKPGLTQREIPDELAISHRSVCRFEKEKRPGFDKAVKIGTRVFHPRSRIEALKAGLLRPRAEG